MTTTAEKTLLQLKDEALAATKSRDLAFYDQYLADDAMAIVPAGVFDKATILDGIAAGRFQSSHVDTTRVNLIGDDAGIVTYVATFGSGDSAKRAFVTTVYGKIEGEWKGLLYQQTPLAGPQPSPSA